MNPATFLRVLGPEPWNVAYVEPSRRPADGRFGDNPNRLFQHHQFQVILKPNPPDTQELYLGSLKAIGIDPREHDIRFVEDDWESPTLGAWGLGWEVWCDGMEITQYTYFQQAGGFEVKPVAAELTYGLERIAMYLQDVENVFDVEWVKGVKYREVFHRNEVEMSEYALRQSDPKMLFGLFDVYEAECRRLLELGLPAAGLRPLPQVLPHLQPARRPRRHQRHRARRLHRARAGAGAPVREGLPRLARGARVPHAAAAGAQGGGRCGTRGPRGGRGREVGGGHGGPSFRDRRRGDPGGIRAGGAAAARPGPGEGARRRAARARRGAGGGHAAAARGLGAGGRAPAGRRHQPGARSPGGAGLRRGRQPDARPRPASPAARAWRWRRWSGWRRPRGCDWR